MTMLKPWPEPKVVGIPLSKKKIVTSLRSDSQASDAPFQPHKQLREFRAKHNITQLEVGKVIGVSHGIIARIENGHIRITSDRAASLEKHFGVEPGTFQHPLF
jgi:DNA-binding XRE family transcriptional regulator